MTAFKEKSNSILLYAEIVEKCFLIWSRIASEIIAELLFVWWVFAVILVTKQIEAYIIGPRFLFVTHYYGRKIPHVMRHRLMTIKDVCLQLG